jgi:hypothetical protein
MSTYKHAYPQVHDLPPLALWPRMGETHAGKAALLRQVQFTVLG